jgi:hypothetical protein
MIKLAGLDKYLHVYRLTICVVANLLEASKSQWKGTMPKDAADWCV